MFDFGEGSMTMTVDPAQHYATESALACLLAWVEARDRDRDTVGQASAHALLKASDQLYRAGVELRTLYDSDDPL